MSNILRKASRFSGPAERYAPPCAVTVVAMLAFAATDIAQAPPVNHQHYQFQHGDAGPVYSSPSSAATWQFVPGRGIVGESCEMPTSACSNEERVTG
jgi:hypothetical protein